MNVEQYWSDVLNQDADSMRTWFATDAWINWHNTNEHFTAEEFIRVNCEYPGNWAGELEQIILTENYIVTAAHVYRKDDDLLHFHVTSFIHVIDEKIISIDEYWGNDGDIPQWRQNLNIGCKIK